MNKKRSLIFTTIVLSIFLVNFISALTLEEATKKTKEYSSTIFNGTISPLTIFLFGGNEAISGEILLAKILFFIIIISIIWKILEQIEFFSEHTGVHWLIAISASILTTQWLSSAELIKTILLPYTTLGIAISAGIPFVLWFVIINMGMKNAKYKTMRRIAWIFFAVIFTGLWITRSSELSANNSMAYLIYPVTAVLAFLMVWMDGTIRGFFLNLELDKVGSKTKRKLIDEYKKDLDELPDLVSRGIITKSEEKKRKKEIGKELKRIMK